MTKPDSHLPPPPGRPAPCTAGAARSAPNRRHQRPLHTRAIKLELAGALAVAVLAMALTLPAPARAEPLPSAATAAADADADAEPRSRAEATPTSVFDMPAVARGIGAALALARAGRHVDAVERLERLAERHPDLPEIAVALALAHAAAGERAAALAHLAGAVERGFRGIRALAADPRMAPLTGDPAFVRLAAAAPADAPDPPPALAPAEPALVAVEGLAAPVSEANTEWVAAEQRLVSRHLVPPVLARRAPLAARGALAGIAPLLNRRYAEGRAAGTAGDLYDNRDRGHSRLDPRLFPQLLHVTYGAAARARELDYGPQRDLGFDRIAFGNSSTAIVRGPLWRSQTRRLLTEPGGPQVLSRQYATNALYVYPDKSDHQPKHGDLMPANTPYAITSQGASGSDRPFLEAIATILAALPPRVKERLRDEGLIAPTVQMILRRTQAGIESDADYMGAAAHPSVFDGARIDLGRAVAAAQALRPGTLPPMARLTLLSETRSGEPRGIFGDGLDEALFDTPAAIARVFRDTAPVRRYLLSARATRDPNGRPLRFHWRLLRGDPGAVRIVPQTEDASVAEVEIAWQDPGPVPGRPDLRNTRLDIAVFADNGETLSAPAFLSVAFPPDQIRRTDAEGRLLEIDHAGDPAAYADPALFPRRSWRDVFERDEEGRVTGWTRYHADGTEEAYAADGARVLSRDEAGRPLEAERVRYPLAPGRARDGRPSVTVAATGERVRYRYAGPGDRIGRAETAD